MSTTSPKTSPKDAKSRSGTTSPGDFLPASHWSALEAAEASDNDADSLFSENSIPYSTESLTESVLAYRTIHGRTYHSDRGNAQYWGSNDEKQSENQDLYHHIQTLLLDDKLFLAPVDTASLKKVVDVGTGTGIWAIDFADTYPHVNVLGIDISPIQPSWVPPNLEFQIDDVTRPWTFEPNSVDYIHMRFLNGSIDDWDALFAEAYRALKPGGILESMEPSAVLTSDDGTVNDDSALAEWARIFHEAGRRSGRPFTVFEDDLQNKAFAANGFVDVTEIRKKCPLGAWPKDPKQKQIGQYGHLMLEQDSEGLILFAANVLNGWKKEEVAVYISQVKRELRSNKKHCHYWQKIVWGRKPLSAE
ncbi:S-adenosyl-L-methionine-dependent methyltransferase [Cladorrhinum sp. PSN259]|nr:S-adenosyl-L-methionine-dependent methyltransferase [Cladorrhinum sp. PSN259]